MVDAAKKKDVEVNRTLDDTLAAAGDRHLAPRGCWFYRRLSSRVGTCLAQQHGEGACLAQQHGEGANPR
jgi:hypothetical protein